LTTTGRPSTCFKKSGTVFLLDMPAHYHESQRLRDQTPATRLPGITLEVEKRKNILAMPVARLLSRSKHLEGTARLVRSEIEHVCSTAKLMLQVRLCTGRAVK
jgi:hypothetical protein